MPFGEMKTDDPLTDLYTFAGAAAAGTTDAFYTGGANQTDNFYAQRGENFGAYTVNQNWTPDFSTRFPQTRNTGAQVPTPDGTQQPARQVSTAHTQQTSLLLPLLLIVGLVWVIR